MTANIKLLTCEFCMQAVCGVLGRVSLDSERGKAIDSSITIAFDLESSPPVVQQKRFHRRVGQGGIPNHSVRKHLYLVL